MVLSGGTFSATNPGATQSQIEIPVSYGTNWGDVQLNVSAASDASDKLVNAIVLTADDGTTVGLYHLDQIWSASELAWKVAFTSGMDGKTITNIRYYCTVKDSDTNDDAAPAYVNYVYDYPTSTAISQVYTGTVTADFTDANTITVTGLPEDAANVMAKVYYTTGGRNATYTYLTPKVVDPQDDDIDPIAVAVVDGKISIVPGSVTNNAGTTERYGEPISGTTYTIELSSDNYIIKKVTAVYTADTYVLMNIPYDKFYAAEGTSDVDAVTSATLNKPRTGTLAGGSYHVNADGSDITGVIFPVLVSDPSVLDGYTQITDDSKIDITVTNRGKETTTTYEGKDALFEAPSYAYYVLSEKPAYFKTLNADGSFSAVSGTVSSVTDVIGEVTVGGRHTDIEIKLSGTEGIDANTVVSGVVLTDAEGNKYGLRHVYNIWRGTELGWDYDEIDLMDKTITNIRYITQAAVIDFPVEITIASPVQPGWQQDGSSWKYVEEDGTYAVDKWEQVDGVWYHFDTNGIMQTGWVQVGSTWYYMNASGAMQTGWVQVGSTWYYMNASGAMQTGWVQVGSTWYYMDSSGAMKTGWQKIGGTWYYMNASGAMQTGWQKIGGTWYYLNASGAMVTGTQTINGRTYRFSSSGQLVG
ncbi:MAG: N-acetylmuramoyl-L-alanine amidase family protein [Oscillospiraceae bacterium]|nr:N-acetylmuramoyl-L-alanine amidase family protein [Oscillospiraceae bacterium]